MIPYFYKPMKTPYKSYTLNEATAKLMKFCAYRERCHKEVRKKLQEMHMIPAAQDEIIYRLVQDDFLNEERFARSFVRGKFRIKKWGKLRLTRELRFREISPFLIDRSLQEISGESYQITFQELVEKKIAALPKEHPLKTKKKLADFLLRKGYESELVYPAVHHRISNIK